MSASTLVNSASTVLGPLLAKAAGAPLPEWEELESRIEERVFARGATVFEQDQAHPFVYAMREGLIKLSYLGEQGNEWIKSFIAERQFFACVAALRPGGRTSFMAAALEPSKVERIHFADIAILAARHLPWATALASLTMTYAARKEQRERELLVLSAEQRFVEFSRRNPNLVERIPQKEIARHLGVTPVGLNRIVSRVRRRAEVAAPTQGTST